MGVGHCLVDHVIVVIKGVKFRTKNMLAVLKLTINLTGYGDREFDKYATIMQCLKGNCKVQNNVLNLKNYSELVLKLLLENIALKYNISFPSHG